MNKDKIITRQAFVRNTTSELIENRQVEFVISSEAVDSHNTVFKMEGWDLDSYNTNPIVSYQHRAFSDNPDDIIGTSEVFVEGEQLIGRVKFEDAAVNPKAEKIFQKVINGTLKMASVGARVLKAKFGDKEAGENEDVLYFHKQRLFEWSIVTAGSNPDALKRNQKTLDEIISEVETEDVAKGGENDLLEKRTKSVYEAQLTINKNNS